MSRRPSRVPAVAWVLVLAGPATLAGCAAPSAGSVSAALSAEPAPAGVAAVGRRVDGIPVFLGLPPESAITGSAVQADGALLRVSITGTTRAGTADVLGFYRRTLAAAGFSASDDRLLPPGSTGMAFGRGHGTGLLVVAVVDRGGYRSFSVGGTTTSESG